MISLKIKSRNCLHRNEVNAMQPIYSNYGTYLSLLPKKPRSTSGRIAIGTLRTTLVVTPHRSVETVAIRSRSSVLFEHERDDRHWSPSSQPFASAEILLKYLRDGWQLKRTVAVQLFQCVSRQCIRLYYFSASRDDKSLTIPVIENPIVLRVIRDNQLELVDYSATSQESAL